ncbi:cytochrome c oxidase subunit II [soil metagenome]
MNRRTRSAAALTVLVLAVACGQQESGAFRPEGTSARELNVLFWVLVVAGAAVFVGVMITLVLAAFASRDDEHRAGEPDEEARRQRHERRSSRLVLGGGVVLPVIVLVPLTIMMLVVGDRLSPRLGDAYEIEVIGHQFWWEVVYPDAGVVTANEIHIPTDTRVRVNLATTDVIHSFWVPQLAGKIDMIPGETTEVLIDAERPGTFIGQCAEFCGVQHARMRFLVIAQPPDEFEQWLVEQAADAAEPESDEARRGADVFVEVGCAACHAVRGTEATGVVGPDLTHLASRQTLGALTLANRRGQLAGWITDPQATKPGNSMPPTPLSSEQLLDLLAYLEGLQ